MTFETVDTARLTWRAAQSQLEECINDYLTAKDHGKWEAKCISAFRLSEAVCLERAAYGAYEDLVMDELSEEIKQERAAG